MVVIVIMGLTDYKLGNVTESTQTIVNTVNQPIYSRRMTRLPTILILTSPVCVESIPLHPSHSALRLIFFCPLLPSSCETSAANCPILLTPQGRQIAWPKQFTHVQVGRPRSQADRPGFDWLCWRYAYPERQSGGLSREPGRQRRMYEYLVNILLLFITYSPVTHVPVGLWLLVISHNPPPPAPTIVNRAVS